MGHKLQHIFVLQSDSLSTSSPPIILSSDDGVNTILCIICEISVQHFCLDFKKLAEAFILVTFEEKLQLWCEK